MSVYSWPHAAPMHKSSHTLVVVCSQTMCQAEKIGPIKYTGLMLTSVIKECQLVVCCGLACIQTILTVCRRCNEHKAKSTNLRWVYLTAFNSSISCVCKQRNQRGKRPRIATAWRRDVYSQLIGCARRIIVCKCVRKSVMTAEVMAGRIHSTMLPCPSTDNWQIVMSMSR